MKKLIIATVGLFFLNLGTEALAQTAKAGSTKSTRVSAHKMTEAQKIDHLIRYVRGLDGAVFIRNGSEYEAKTAAEHLQMKREKAGSRLKTARDFIEGVASESYFSGKKYQIRMKDGKTYFSHDVLLKELNRIENQN